MAPQVTLMLRLLSLAVLLSTAFASASAATLRVTSGTLHKTGGPAAINESYRIKGTFSVDVNPGSITFYNDNFTTQDYNDYFGPHVDTGWVFPLGGSGTPITVYYSGNTLGAATCPGLNCPVFHGTFDGSNMSLTGSYSDGLIDVYNYNFSLSAVTVPPPGNIPVPAAGWLFGSALAGLAATRRRH